MTTSNFSHLLRLAGPMAIFGATVGYASAADAQQAYRLSASGQKAEAVASAPAAVAQPGEPIGSAQLNMSQARPAVIQPVPSMEAIAQAQAAQAASAPPPPPAADRLGLYFGVGGSYSKTDSGVTDLTGSAKLDEDSFGYKVFAGYQLNKILSAEIQYADLGEFGLTGNAGDSFRANGRSYTFAGDNSEIGISTWSVGAAGIVMLPVSDMFNPFAKLGVHRWSSEATATNSTVNVSASETGIDLYFGGGLQMNITDLLSLRGEYERYIIDNDAMDVFTGSLMLRL